MCLVLYQAGVKNGKGCVRLCKEVEKWGRHIPPPGAYPVAEVKTHGRRAGTGGKKGPKAGGVGGTAVWPAVSAGRGAGDCRAAGEQNLPPGGQGCPGPGPGWGAPGADGRRFPLVGAAGAAWPAPGGDGGFLPGPGSAADPGGPGPTKHTPRPGVGGPVGPQRQPRAAPGGGGTLSQGTGAGSRCAGGGGAAGLLAVAGIRGGHGAAGGGRRSGCGPLVRPGRPGGRCDAVPVRSQTGAGRSLPPAVPGAGGGGAEQAGAALPAVGGGASGSAGNQNRFHLVPNY